MVAATLIIVINGLTRYFLNFSMTWAEESVRYIMILTVCVGASLAIRHGVHVKIDVLLVKLPFKAEKFMICVTYLLAAFFCLFLIWAGYHNTLQLQRTGQISTSMIWLRIWVVQLPIVLFGILGAKDYLQLFVLNLVRRDEIVRTIGWTQPATIAMPVVEKKQGGEAK